MVEESARQRSVSRVRLWLAALLVVVVAVGFLLRPQEVWTWLKENQSRLEQAVQDHLTVTIAAMFIVYVIVTGLSLPFAASLTLIYGAILGRWLALAVVSFASTAGATFAFLLSRFLLRDWVRKRYGPRLEAIDRGVERSGVYYLLMLRLNPIVPYFLINLALGLTRMPVWTFWIVSQFGMLPMTFLYVSAAAEVARVESPGDIVSPRVLAYLVLASLTPLLLRQVFQRTTDTMAASPAESAGEQQRP